jgi:hypothetical protein
MKIIESSLKDKKSILMPKQNRKEKKRKEEE